MLLYKYVSFSAGLKILETQTIGFRQPSLFNDPFEVLAAYATPARDDPFSAPRTSAKIAMLSDNHAILSLTRSPNNPLMWAHYGDQHRGWVIGFDLDNDLFRDYDKNTIPVQHGNMLYTSTRPTHDLIVNGAGPFKIDGQQSYMPENAEKLQRAFLYKSAVWQYEEEVRIVKCCRGIASEGFRVYPSGTFSRITDGIGALFLLKLPPGSIKTIHAGVRNIKKIDFARARGFDPSVKIFMSWVDDGTWTVKSSECSI